MEVEAAVHTRTLDMAEDHDSHYLVSVAGTNANDAVHEPCMDEGDVDTSSELMRVDDSVAGDDDDDAVEAHSSH